MSTLAPSLPHQSRRPWYRSSRTLAHLFSHIVLLFFSLIIVYPIVWMVITSFKTQSDLLSNLWGLPKVIAWQNYSNSWQAAELGYALFNSFLVAAVTTLLVAVLAAAAGYALSVFRFRFAAGRVSPCAADCMSSAIKCSSGSTSFASVRCRACSTMSLSSSGVWGNLSGV